MDKFDYLLKNGHVIDPENNIDEVFDIGILDNKIAKVQKNIAENCAEKVIDLAGLYVTPGIIDAHVHCYYTAGIQKAWAGEYSLQPDYFNFPSGVTTMIDVGSSGSANFEHFRTTVIDRSKTKIYALLNIADYGMGTLMVEQFPKLNNYDDFIECSKKHSDVIKGIKVAHYWGKDWDDIDYANKVKKELNTPIMVDFGVFKKERPYDQLLMEKLNKGDITTHCFRGPVPIVDENGQVYNYLYKARERGIVFDLGHGAGSFILRNAVPAIQQGFLPDIISSDLHALSINLTTPSMTDVLSKVLACGEISLMELFRRVTETPKKVFKLENVGNLTVGESADIAVWKMNYGEFGFKDVANGRVISNKKLECEMTFCNGELVYDLNARSAIDYEELPPQYGFDPEKEELVIPTYN